MLDMERIRNDPDELRRTLASRFMDTDGVGNLLSQDALRRKLTMESQAKKALRTELSLKVRTLKEEGASDETVMVILHDMRTLGTEIAVIDEDIAELDDKINAFLLSAPNYLHASVPVGNGELNNEEVYRRGKPNTFNWEAKPYWNIGSVLEILEFGGSTTLNDAQDTVYRGLGVQLEYAVIAFLQDAYTQYGYREVKIPHPVLGEGQETAQNTPLSESSAIHLYRDMVLDEAQLPVRRAISAAPDSGEPSTRQNTATELIAICKPEQSYDELSDMAEQLQKALRLLGIPCRVMLKCTGETTHSAAKTYSIEAWMPGYNRFVSMAECSNCEDYFARQLNIRCCGSGNSEPRLCHTLSGSGIAVGRTVAAVLENHQYEDGSVAVPEALKPYMHTDVIK